MGLVPPYESFLVGDGQGVAIFFLGRDCETSLKKGWDRISLRDKCFSGFPSSGGVGNGDGDGGLLGGECDPGDEAGVMFQAMFVRLYVK